MQYCIGLEKKRPLVGSPPAQPISFPRTDDRHRDKIHSSLTSVYCFDDAIMWDASAWGRTFCAVLVKRTPGKHG